VCAPFSTLLFSTLGVFYDIKQCNPRSTFAATIKPGVNPAFVLVARLAQFYWGTPIAQETVRRLRDKYCAGVVSIQGEW